MVDPPLKDKCQKPNTIRKPLFFRPFSGASRALLRAGDRTYSGPTTPDTPPPPLRCFHVQAQGVRCQGWWSHTGLTEHTPTPTPTPRPPPNEPPFFCHFQAQDVPCEGQVVAHGPGRTHPLTGTLIPMCVAEGDTVLFSRWSGRKVREEARGSMTSGGGGGCSFGGSTGRILGNRSSS